MKSESPIKKLQLKIHNMHCTSCEVLIERKFIKIPGVEKANVNHANGKAEVYYTQEPKLHELQNALKEDGYSVSLWQDGNSDAQEGLHKNTQKDYLEIGAIVLTVTAAYLMLQQVDVVPKNIGISDNMSYGFVFLIGLVAALSTCMAVTGGLLLGVAAKYNQKYPTLAGFQKFKPHLYFNTGRVASYTLLGGAVGALGSVLTFSPKANGFMTILASLVMILLGFQLLKLFPQFKRFSLRMPKFLAHKIQGLTSYEKKGAPFLLGASTFFLPCGFTQALQLYVLAKGDFVTGALTMLAFSLGTMPALLSLSALSSFAQGAFRRYFLKFSGVLVIILGFYNLNNGLALTGSSVSLASIFLSSGKTNAQASPDTNVQIVGGKQIVRMKVIGLDYYPYRFKVVEGVPVEWRIDGSQAEGCAQIITVPQLGITEYIPRRSEKKILFTSRKTGTLVFSCTMGMTTRGASFIVVPNTTGIVAAPEVRGTNDTSSAEGSPEIANRIPPQKIFMEISQERGIYPRIFTVKKGVPVELTIDDRVPLGGCMSVMIIPQYDVAVPLKLGKNKLTFTPTKTGKVPITCSMGSPMALIVVVS